MKLMTQSLTFIVALLVLMLPHQIANAQSTQSVAESEYYPISPLPVPDGIILEAGGLAFGPEGELMVPTRRGDVWRITNPGGDAPGFQRFAQGLHEPLGIAYRNNSWIIAQRGDLIRLEDINDDDRADRFSTIYRWPLTGNYHEYSYGPKFLPNGEMLVTLNLSWIGEGSSLTDWRGWMVRITEDGEMNPYATGLRSPIGFGFNADGDIFYAENQGDWIGSGWLTHLEEGDFAGNPEGLKWSGMPGSPIDLTYEEVAAIDDSQQLPLSAYTDQFPELKLPAVWFPHAIMGISTSDILLIENDDQLGPYAGQLLVADQGHSKLNRVFLEKVKGEYQGVAFAFREGFNSGVIKLEWGADNTLFAGMTSRGWNSTGRSPFGIDRMSWTGEVPFEMQKMEAESNGFTITFTHPVDVPTAENPDSYQVTGFTYIYHRIYGSPVINREEHPVTSVVVADDGLSARLIVDGLREKYIHEVRAEGVRSTGGETLLHPVGYYTLNNFPDAEEETSDSSGANREVMQSSSSPDGATTAGAGGSDSDKKVTSLPAGWSSDEVVSIDLGTTPGLQYDTQMMTVEAGDRVALTFSNSDDMLHNVVIVRPGSADAVGQAAMQLGLDGDAMEYVPEMADVIAHSSLLAPGESETIYFQVPQQPGDYTFVCTFPGHYITMRGVLRVE